MEEEEGHTKSPLEEVGRRHISQEPQDSHMLHALVVGGKRRGESVMRAWGSEKV